MAKMILHVYYSCPRATAEAFLNEMKSSGVLEAVRQEDGCERYTYYFPAEGEGFMLTEQWRDEEALAAHAAGEPMAALKKIKAGYEMETRIEKFKAEAL